MSAFFLLVLGWVLVLHMCLPVLISVPSHFSHLHVKVTVNRALVIPGAHEECDVETAMVLPSFGVIKAVLYISSKKRIDDVHLHACTCTKILIGTCIYGKSFWWKVQLGEKLLDRLGCSPASVSDL